MVIKTFDPITFLYHNDFCQDFRLIFNLLYKIYIKFKTFSGANKISCPSDSVVWESCLVRPRFWYIVLVHYELNFPLGWLVIVANARWCCLALSYIRDIIRLVLDLREYISGRDSCDHLISSFKVTDLLSSESSSSSSESNCVFSANTEPDTASSCKINGVSSANDKANTVSSTVALAGRADSILRQLGGGSPGKQCRE